MLGVGGEAGKQLRFGAEIGDGHLGGRATHESVDHGGQTTDLRAFAKSCARTLHQNDEGKRHGRTGLIKLYPLRHTIGFKGEIARMKTVDGVALFCAHFGGHQHKLRLDGDDGLWIGCRRALGWRVLERFGLKRRGLGRKRDAGEQKG